MNFPMENELMQILYWLVNTPGLGGLISILLGGGSILTYALMLRWIIQGGNVREDDIYLYPTPSFHKHE